MNDPQRRKYDEVHLQKEYYENFLQPTIHVRL